MTTPVLGMTEWAAAQASPWTPHNVALRTLEQGAMWFRFIDRDLATPPVSPSEGDCYLVAASGTGDWSGHDGDIAFYSNSAWSFIEPLEGMGGAVLDEDAAAVYFGGSWVTLESGSAALREVPVFNFTSDGEARFYADIAMTLTQQATSGTGTVAYEKSTTAAPSTFSSTSSPITLEAGAWLKVSASSVTTLFAVALKRTA